MFKYVLLDQLVIGRNMFKIRCLIVWSQKYDVRVWLPKDEYIQVRSMFKIMMVKSVRWVI